MSEAIFKSKRVPRKPSKSSPETVNKDKGVKKNNPNSPQTKWVGK